MIDIKLKNPIINQSFQSSILDQSLGRTCVVKGLPFCQVLVFAERTGEVDNILESLITSGVEAVAVHGGLDQQDREYAISAFKVPPSPLRPSQVTHLILRAFP